jgi:rhamnose transport system permease protein
MLARFLLRPEVRTFLLLLVILGLAAVKEPRLLETNSLSSILLWIPLLVVMAIGQMGVIVTRGIDVSIGSTLGFAGICVGMIFRSNPEMNVFLGALIGLGIGVVLGFINGALVALAKVPPIIATLGTLSAYRGLVFIVSGGAQVDSNHIPQALTDWTLHGPVTIFGITIPWLVVLSLAIAAIAHYFFAFTRTGRNMFAIGSNPEAAHLRGVPVRSTVLIAYTISGALAGLAGVMYASRYGYVNPGSAGVSMELTVIAATVIGGCEVTGGSGSILGVLLGCVLLGAVNVALSVLGISANWQLLVYGAVIIGALFFDAVASRLQNRRAAEASA